MTPIFDTLFQLSEIDSPHSAGQADEIGGFDISLMIQQRLQEDEKLSRILLMHFQCCVCNYLRSSEKGDGNESELDFPRFDVFFLNFRDDLLAESAAIFALKVFNQNNFDWGACFSNGGKPDGPADYNRTFSSALANSSHAEYQQSSS